MGIAVFAIMLSSIAALVFTDHYDVKIEKKDKKVEHVHRHR